MNLNRTHLEQLGEEFELEILSYLQLKYPQSEVLHNYSIYCEYLKKDTQMDLIFITSKNVYIIETKNWVGFIRGNYNDKHWEGRSRSKTTMTVFNPVNQNALHIRTLRNALRVKGINPPIFRNLVVVPDGTEIKSDCTEVINQSLLLQKITHMENNSNLLLDTTYMKNSIKGVCL